MVFVSSNVFNSFLCTSFGHLGQPCCYTILFYILLFSFSFCPSNGAQSGSKILSPLPTENATIISSFSPSSSSSYSDRLVGQYVEQLNNFFCIWQGRNPTTWGMVTFFHPLPAPTFYTVGDYAQANWKEPGTFVTWAQPYGPVISLKEVSSGGPSKLLVPPLSFRKIWTSIASGVTIWEPVVPNKNYTALGHVATLNGTAPEGSNVRVVYNGPPCVLQCALGPLIWYSNGTKNDTGIKIFGIAPPRGASADKVVTGTFFAFPPSAVPSQVPCLYSSCLTEITRDPTLMDVPKKRSPQSMCKQSL
jgi:hypothetical protein